MSPARRYFNSRAISPQVAYDAGVRPGRNANELAFPNGRRRVLNTGRVLQEKGKPLRAWALNPSKGWRTALVCEGESDSLAALTAIRKAPEQSGIFNLPILCIPGTGFPLDRLLHGLTLASALGITEALLASDPDDAGNKFVAAAAEVLLAARIRPVRIEVPKPDLAGWLVTVEGAERGERLASLLIDSELAAPTKAELLRRREVTALRARADELEMAS